MVMKTTLGLLLACLLAVSAAAQVSPRSRSLETFGDNLWKDARDLDGQVTAAAAWESAWNVPNPSPTLPLKLARVYGTMLRIPDATSSLLTYATNALLRLPPNINGSPRDRQEYAFARSCALLHARCYPQLIETLKSAGDDTEVQGIRDLLELIGAASFARVSGPDTVAGDYSVIIWKSMAPPPIESLPRVAFSVIVDSREGPSSFSLTRFTISGTSRYYLYANHPDGEELLHSYGETMPSLEALHARVSLELTRRLSATSGVRS